MGQANKRGSREQRAEMARARNDSLKAAILKNPKHPLQRIVAQDRDGTIIQRVASDLTKWGMIPKLVAGGLGGEGNS
jgi:hypothetical protein